MQALRNWLWGRWDFFLHHFLTHFCHFLPLPLTCLAVLGLLSGAIGAGVGAQHLIYHDDPTKQVVAGFALTLVVVECLLIGYLFEYGRRRRQYQGGFFTYALQTVASFALCLVIVWGASEALGELVSFAGQASLAGSEPPRQPFRPQWNAGVFIGVEFAAAVSAAVFILCRKWFGPVSREKAADVPHRPSPGGGPSHFVYLFWLVIASCVWYIAVTYVASRTGYLGGNVRPELLVGLAFAAALAVVTLYALNRVPVLLMSRRTLYAEVACNMRLPAHLARARYQRVALVFAVASVAVTVGLSYTPAAASPVTPLCALWLLFLAAYGFLSVVVRRGLSILGAGLVIMLALAGTPPYKFRFHGLEDEYRHGPLELDVHAAEDALRQEKLVRFIDELEKSNASGLPELRAAVKAVDEVHRKATREERQAQGLSEALETARKELRSKEYELFLGTGDRFTDDEKRFAKNRVVPLRDPRLGSPLERAAEEAHARKTDGRLLWMSDIAFLPQSSDRSKAKKRPLVIVTVSGGGARSAAWTLRVLQELEQRVEQEMDAETGKLFHFPAHVRLIAGASGGMLGAGYYTATLDAPGRMSHGPERRIEMREQYDMLTQDFLTPLVKAGVYSDLPLFLSPSPVRHDRGRVLEQEWERELQFRKGPEHEKRNPLGMTFEQLRSGETEGWRPSLVFSPMLIEDGRRLLISNLDLRWVAHNGGSALDPTGHAAGGPNPVDLTNGWAKEYSFEAFELFRLFPEAINKFQLSTAVRMSASFPYFSPAASLPTWPRRRVVDAGYFDNYGVSVAASWLFSTRNEEWIRENVSKVLIIQIRDGVSDEQRRLKRVAAESSSTLSRSVEEFISPIEGLDNGRVGSSSFRNDGQLELLTKYFRASSRQSLSDDHRARYVTTVTFEFPLSAALSWYLSAGEKAAIDMAAAGKEDAVAYIADQNQRDAAARELKLHKERLDRVAQWFQFVPPVPKEPGAK